MQRQIKLNDLDDSVRNTNSTLLIATINDMLGNKFETLLNNLVKD